MFQSGGQNQKWPTSGPTAYITLAVGGGGGVHCASKRGTKSEVAHKCARWLHNPCHLRGVPCVSKRGTALEVAHKWA